MTPALLPQFHRKGSTLVREHLGEILQIEPWGRDSIRLRATRNPTLVDTDWALLPPRAGRAAIHIGDGHAELRHGTICVRVSLDGLLKIENLTTKQVLLEEQSPRTYLSKSGGLFRTEVSFVAHDDERFYGLGQHPHGFLDQKGCSIALEQRNTQVNIPFLISSRGYGLLWNHPGIGRVDLSRNVTRWVANSAPQLDLWITAGPAYAQILRNYADATGHAPDFPKYASGFWQCKLRYRSQEEILAVAREHHRRGLPMSVIVVDYFHWTAMGDWKFDPKDWPDPTGMVRDLAALGIELMVSVWPTVNAHSENFAALESRNLLVGTERGLPVVTHFIDVDSNERRVYLHHYDATNPEARRFLWQQLRKNYLEQGIRIFWLDACEPELNPFHHDNIRYHLGNGETVGCWFPRANAQAIFEGMASAGETEILTLSRSAWAGSQRYGCAVWSGDIPSTFASLRQQIRAGLNMAMSGIPWWTTDIGGFHSGDPASPAFRELIVRWFQFGVFCPIFRLHGVRLPNSHTQGGPNEVWSFGDDAYRAIRPLLFLREAMRPYIHRHMKIARQGLPLMRPVFVDFQDDPRTHTIEDAFLFGPDVLVTPVAEAKMRRRSVYLPQGADWINAWTGERKQGGVKISVAAPVDRIPVFVRAGSDCLKWFDALKRLPEPPASA